MATFSLTTSADDITGTGRDDTFEGGTNTLQTFDTIDGGGGRDVLRASVNQNGTQAPTIRNVEELYLDTGGLPFSLSNISNGSPPALIATQGASIVLEDVERLDLRSKFGAETVESGTVNIRFADGALDGDSDTIRFVVDASNVTFTSDSSFDSTNDGEQNQTEDALRVERMSIDLEGSRPEAQFDNQVDVSDFSAVRDLILSGDANSKITIASPELELVNASRTTGGITLASDIEGSQLIIGGSGDDDFKTGSGNDRILGGEGNDVINAGEGDNTLNGGAGDDELTSESGNDRVFGRAGDDRIDSGSGDDVIVAGAGNDDVSAGGGNDTIFGREGNDTIRAGGGNDSIRDGAGDDVVFGGGGADNFLAGAGNDTFDGGGGVDRFLFNRGAFDTDTVENFTLTSTTETNDVVVFTFEGNREALRSQDDYEEFANDNPNAFSFDSATSIITIQADDGTIILEASDTDFLVA